MSLLSPQLKNAPLPVPEYRTYQMLVEGRIGLERTFAGARTVRVLAIRDRGDGPIGLERVDRNGSTALIAGCPTYRDAAHAWSFRS